MNLKPLFAAASRLAFGIAGDVNVSAVLKTQPANSYDPATGDTTQTWTATTIKALPFKAKDEKQQPTSPEKTIKHYLFDANAAGIDPSTINRECRINAEGIDWVILAVEIDPAGITVNLTVEA